MTNEDYLWSSDSNGTSTSENSSTGAGSSGQQDQEPLLIHGNNELRNLVLTLLAAADAQQGASAYDYTNLLNECPHCGRSITANAYRVHIRAHF